MTPLLKGLRILDLTTVILGPYGTQILGDLGAEVIKVEPPEGDSMRPVAPLAAPGISAIFSNFNRNKRSVALDLKTEAGKAALRKLIATADVFVHNMRQEAMDKLGFTFKAVREANPRIVYAAAVGFGRHGRYAGKPAYDDVIQAASGFAGLFEMRDGTPLYAPSIAADKVSGIHLAYAMSRCRCSS
jgi:crotonobetainyl-CoA:carnitine CoA-transferase CaiB-like acyl-CoA transferase